MELIALLDKIETISIENSKEKEILLNKTLKYLNNLEFLETILILNLRYASISFQEENSHNFEKILDFLIKNKFKINRNEQLNFYLLKAFLNKKVFNKFSIKDYVLFLKNIFLSINIEIENTYDINLLFNHCIDCFGLENVYEIHDEFKKINKNNLLKTNNMNIISFFSKKDSFNKLDPNEFFKKFKIDNIINLFLKLIEDSFENSNVYHQNWLNAIIDNDSSKIFSSTFFSFIKKNDSLKLKESFLKQKNGDLINFFYYNNYQLKNYNLDIKNINEINNFRELVEKFYLTKSKKVVKILAELCFQNNSFDFSYIYFGEVINSLDINKIQEILIYIKENKISFVIPRFLISHEKDIINRLSNFFPKKNIGEFLFKNGFNFSKLSQFFILANKYIDFLFKKEYKRKDLFSLIECIEQEIVLLNNTEFNFKIDKSLLDSKILNYRLKQPENSHELRRWGISLSNCLVNDIWAINVFFKKTAVYGLLTNDTITYSIEILDRKIKQIEGKNKALPNEELILAINSFFKEKLIID